MRVTITTGRRASPNSNGRGRGKSPGIYLLFWARFIPGIADYV
jgi:hypothetical protein